VNLAEARACLGLTREATPDEAQAAYRRRATMLHPDKYATASPAMQQEAGRAMQQLNEALAVLQQPRSPEDDVPGERDVPRGRPPLAHECLFCGSTPAAHIAFRKVTGLALGHRVEGLSEAFCRACGLSMWREAQASTCVRGWWGVLAWARTLLVLRSNLSARRTLRRLAPAESRDPDVRTPLFEPAPPVRPVPRRPAVWAACAGALVVVGTLLPAALAPGPEAPATVPATDVGARPPAGTCLDGTGLVIGCDSLAAVAQVANIASSDTECVPGDFYLPWPEVDGGICLRRLR
jgi:hypothetical protein